MTHRVRCEHQFRCDEEGCRNKEVIRQIRSKRPAKRLLREKGWSVYDGQHFCPEHNTKETPEGWEGAEV